MNKLLRNINYSLILIFITLVSWEHLSKIHESQIKPSIYITHIATRSRSVFEYIGKQFGRLSKFITYLKFEELFITITDVLNPLFNLCTSPFYIIKGYTDVVLEYKWPVLICIGSTIIICGVLYLLLWLKRKYYLELVELKHTKVISSVSSDIKTNEETTNDTAKSNIEIEEKKEESEEEKDESEDFENE
jgi:hypothetical protein